MYCPGCAVQNVEGTKGHQPGISDRSTVVDCDIGIATATPSPISVTEHTTEPLGKQHPASKQTMRRNDG